MQIEYDENKRLKTLTERGYDFAMAEIVFKGLNYEFPSPQNNHGEARFITVGQLLFDVVAIVWTWRGEKKRIISIRKARDYERERYYDRAMEIR
jgi:uncharacterized protein